MTAFPDDDDRVAAPDDDDPEGIVEKHRFELTRQDREERRRMHAAWDRFAGEVLANDPRRTRKSD